MSSSVSFRRARWGRCSRLTQNTRVRRARFRGRDGCAAGGGGGLVGRPQRGGAAAEDLGGGGRAESGWSGGVADRDGAGDAADGGWSGFLLQLSGVVCGRAWCEDSTRVLGNCG